MDSHVYAGYEVPPYYDSLLGKLIVWAPDRPTAIARARVALDETLIEGIVTNLPIHRALLVNEQFLEGRMTTNLLDRLGPAAFLAAAASANAAAATAASAAAAASSNQPTEPARSPR
jgi:acetyl/propionyl-CoA carboxylase alpha subunit